MIERELGRGGMGQVWLGRDHQGGRYAIKTLREDLAVDRDVVRRFIREREVLLSLNHPGLVRIHDMVIEGRTMAFIMDLVEGGDLAEFIATGGPMAPTQVARFGADVADALAYAHAAGVVHRDLKPANILIDTTVGSQPRPRLADFGIATLASASTTTHTALVGTVQYLAPELFDGKQPTAAVDVYSLGFVLYEMLHGRAPFSGHSTARVMAMHARALPGRPSGVPDQMWTLILDMVAKHPQARPPAAEVRDRLQAMGSALRGLPPSSRTSPTPTPVWPDDEWTSPVSDRSPHTAPAGGNEVHDALTKPARRGDEVHRRDPGPASPGQARSSRTRAMMMGAGVVLLGAIAVGALAMVNSNQKSEDASPTRSEGSSSASSTTEAEHTSTAADPTTTDPETTTESATTTEPQPTTPEAHPAQLTLGESMWGTVAGVDPWIGEFDIATESTVVILVNADEGKDLSLHLSDTASSRTWWNDDRPYALAGLDNHDLDPGLAVRLTPGTYELWVKSTGSDWQTSADFYVTVVLAEDVTTDASLKGQQAEEDGWYAHFTSYHLTAGQWTFQTISESGDVVMGVVGLLPSNSNSSSGYYSDYYSDDQDGQGAGLATDARISDRFPEGWVLVRVSEDEGGAYNTILQVTSP